MFVAKNLIRMHDIDMAGILYFPRQFRFVHEALEDFMASLGFSFPQVFQFENFLFVIVHCESDYLKPLIIGDRLEIHVAIGHIGTTSFSINYSIYKDSGLHVGNAQTVHVTIDSRTRQKILIPPKLKTALEKHLNSQSKQTGSDANIGS